MFKKLAKIVIYTLIIFTKRNPSYFVTIDWPKVGSF